MLNHLDSSEDGGFSDNSVECQISEYHGFDRSGVERSVISYLKGLGVKMLTNPRRK